MSLMKTFDALPPEHQLTVKAMSDASRAAMQDAGLQPLNDDRAAVFDEACAVYLSERLKADGGDWKPNAANLWVLVQDAGTDAQTVYMECSTYSVALNTKYVNEKCGHVLDIMKRLPDGTLTTEY
jgi:hypothetical protein